MTVSYFFTNLSKMKNSDMTFTEVFTAFARTEGSDFGTTEKSLAGALEPRWAGRTRCFHRGQERVQTWMRYSRQERAVFLSQFCDRTQVLNLNGLCGPLCQMGSDPPDVIEGNRGHMNFKGQLVTRVCGQKLFDLSS